MISKFFIDRPIFATVTALIIVVAGLLALDYLPVAQYPEITPPTVQVAAVYPGASAQTVAQTIGIPIEQQVNGVDGMLYMSSTSSSSGMYSLTITFEVGTDIDMATVMVQNRVSIAQPSLPQPVIVQGITTRKQSTNIVMMLTLNSDNPLYNGLYLSNYASINLVDELTRLPGVGQVSVMGAGNYSMRVWLNPQAMRIRNVTPEMVYSTIQAQNMEVSAGYVGQPISDGYDPYQYTLTVQGRLATPEQFGEIVIRSEEGGRLLRLRDIARIEQGSASYNVVSKLNGKETAAVAIYQLPGSNSLDVSKVVRQKMEQLASSLPEGVHYEVTLDTTDVVNASIHEVLITFLITTLLVVLVIYLFLQNFRAVIIPCLTIPVSLIGTLAVMLMLGFSINTLTLFGLILAIAIVVDDAIVVVENASRLLSTGKYNAKDAVTEAMREITGPVIGVVLVLLAVFIPTTFISSISGQLYKQFALTIAASTVLSGFNSLTLTPALCALFLQKEREPRFFLFRAFNKGFDKTTDFYTRIANTLLNHPAPTMIGYGLLTVLALWLFMRWPTSFIPTEDEGYFLVSVQLPPASSLVRTEAVGEQVGKILNRYPEVKSYIGVSGFSIMGGGEQTNNGTFFVILKNWSDRKGKEHAAEAVVNRFNRDASVIQAAQIFAMVPPAIPGLGAFGGLQMELEDRNNLGATELQNAVQALLQNYRTHPQLLQLSSMYQANVPQYFLNIDRDKVQVMGLQLNQVFQTLSLFMGASYVNDYVQYGRIYQVKIEASDQAQKVIGDVLKLGVLNSEGKMVPFAAFTTIEEQLGLDQISRYNMYSAAAVSAVVNPKYSSGQGIRAMEDLVHEQLGNEFGYEWTSVAYQENKSSSTTTLIFGLALIVVILVLAAQYESWTSPIAVILGLPVALLGTVLGCFIMGIPISIYTQIGVVLLIALSAKNGILVVEFARDYRAQGNSIHEAALEGGRVWLRPILMTSFAFVFGVMPLLFATGAGAASRISLGTAVVFGMAMNAIFATLFVPNFYAFMQTIQEKYLDRKKPHASGTPSEDTNLPAVQGEELPAVRDEDRPEK
ncbi:MAG: multidrug efflux RND transporter permease subunit [Parabacteroides sp.]|nr:multidrug efflux RND transporter permease subunit [Parabacteroides sp.]